MSRDDRFIKEHKDEIVELLNIIQDEEIFTSTSSKCNRNLLKQLGVRNIISKVGRKRGKLTANTYLISYIQRVRILDVLNIENRI